MSEATWALGEGPDGERELAVHGEFDLAAEAAFMDDVERLLADDASPVELDLSGVSFMDSSGVRVLMILRQRYGPQIVVGELSEPVHSLFVTAGVLDWLSNDLSDDADVTSEPQHDRGAR